MTKYCKSGNKSKMGVKRDHDSVGITISEDEAALYDRQIRLWGLNCQKRLRDATILIIGLNGLGVEIVKNLSLSGVKSITIMDETPVSELDYSAQYFVVGSEPGSTRAEASKSAIEELNPNVKISIDKDPLDSKDATFFATFRSVFATGIRLPNLVKVNKICHDQNVQFFCGDTWGIYGYGFLDLVSHRYSKKKKVDNGEEMMACGIHYCTLEYPVSVQYHFGLRKKASNIFVLFQVMYHFYEKNKRWPSPQSFEADFELLKASRDFKTHNLKCDKSKIPDDMLREVFGELSPVCAAVGGIMANEMIKGISGQGEPLNNFFLFNGNECTGVEERFIQKYNLPKRFPLK